MAARAIWKGVIRLGDASLPVKLYSAVQDRSVRFRLLHEADRVPVKQKMVNPQTGDPVEYEEIRKAFPLGRGRLVVLEEEELESLEPEPSRDIQITRFVDPAEIDHRWYERAYYLGPDRSAKDYFALAAALEKSGREGVARWVMRKKSYVGSLVTREGYLVLNALRNAEEVVVAEDLPRPDGRALDRREVEMAEQLVEALAGSFDPAEFRDEYRERVLELVEAKAKGGTVKLRKFKPKAQPDESLDRVLKASLAAAGKRRSGGRG